MDSTQFIDFATNRTVASLNRTDFYFLINQVQNHILGRNTPIMRVQPDPYFTTVDDQYTYVANTSLADASTETPGGTVGDVRAITRIYRESGRDGICAIGFLYGPDGINTLGTLYGPEEIPLYGDRYTEVRSNVACISSKTPEDNGCIIKWPARLDPQNHTKKWRAEAYLWCPQITDEGQLLSVPDRFCTTLLLNGVMEYVQTNEFGRSDFPSKEFQAALIEFDDFYGLEMTQQGYQNYGRAAYRDC